MESKEEDIGHEEDTSRKSKSFLSKNKKIVSSKSFQLLELDKSEFSSKQLKRTTSFPEYTSNSKNSHPPSPNEVKFNYDKFYNDLAQFLPEKKYTRPEISLLAACGVFATISSIYYFTFGSAYIQAVAGRWGFDPAQAKFFGDFCGIVSVITNTAINSQSLKKAYEVIKLHIQEKLTVKNRKADDNSSRVQTVINLVLSAIGAVPNEKFVYDTSKDSNIVYLVIMEIVQFFVVWALNFRGLHNISTAKFRREKDSIVFCQKKDLLGYLNNMLTQSAQLKEKQLEALAHGDIVEKRVPYVRGALGLLFGLYTFGYSSAFYFAVQEALPTPDIGNFVDDIIKFGETGCAILSAGLKFVFLGYAYYTLVDKIFALFDNYILTANKKKVSADFITQNGQRWLALFGSIAALLTLGSSSKIVEKYFFENVAKTAQTFWLSLAFGGGAAYGINAGDLLSLFERMINFVVHVVRTMILRYDPSHRFGNTHDEMVMQIMLRVATMSDTDFLQTFIHEFTDKDDVPKFTDKDDVPTERDVELGEAVTKLKDQGHFFHHYCPNRFFKIIESASHGLQKVMDNVPFLEFKKKYDDVNKEKKESNTNKETKKIKENQKEEVEENGMRTPLISNHKPSINYNT